jgi:DNA topoisomerase-1
MSNESTPASTPEEQETPSTNPVTPETPAAETAAPAEKKKKTPKTKAKGAKTTKAKVPSGKQLVIVESPSKAKTINKYLGSEFLVLASKGHLIDLPKSKLGVDLEKDFEPQYIAIRGKASIIKELKVAAKKSKSIYIATDPDREGEAIGWHISNFLTKGKDATTVPMYRLRLNEITKNAIQDAIKDPSEVDLNMVNAQQARRVLDRLVGYGISPILWKHIRRGLSAGRVQSVTLRLIYEREKEIAGFKPEEYWTLEADFITASGALLRTRLSKVDGAKPDLKNEAQVNELVKRLLEAEFKIASVNRSERSKKAPFPFTTSKLQQEAYKQLKYSARKTMSIAQGLYEGVDIGESAPVGLITYMRTDSKRISPEAKAEAAKYIKDTFGAEYVELADRVAPGKAGAKVQDAHEAIRPTSVFRSPEQVKAHLTPEQYKLYKLIWEDYLASQMTSAKYAITSVDVDGGGCMFRASGTEKVFDGFTRIYEEAADEDASAKRAGAPAEGEDAGQEAGPNQLPKVAQGEKVDWKEPKQEQHFTQPPPRYTDASLIKILEEMGIGRPSTYAPTLMTIEARHYCSKDSGRFFLTELGNLVLELLLKNFPNVLDYAFTAKMEGELDQVENGTIQWRSVLREFYEPFKGALAEADKMMGEEKIEIITDIPCEKCGKPMVAKWGRHGKFLACSGYPECHSTRGLKETTDGSIVPEEPLTTNEICPKCQSPMQVRMGRFGRFLACTKYPECKSTKAISLGIACPLGCGGDVVSRRARMGRVFYGCNKYPDCKFISWYKPVQRPCPLCANPYLVEKFTKTLGPHISCPNKECDYKELQNAEGSPEGVTIPPPEPPPVVFP